MAPEEQPTRAIEALEPVTPHELGFVAALAPMYLRGQSLMMLGVGVRAAHEFQRILDHRGSDPFSPLHAVASLGLARAHAMTGNISGSLHAYQSFLTTWAQAHPDLPVLHQAQGEFDHRSSTAFG